MQLRCVRLPRSRAPPHSASPKRTQLTFSSTKACSTRKINKIDAGSVELKMMLINEVKSVQSKV